MARRTKTRKINSKLITILLVLSVPVLIIMAIALDSKRPFLPNSVHKMLGRDPQELLVKAQDSLGHLESYYSELKAQANAVSDPKEAAETWDELFKEKYAVRAKEVYHLINDVRRFGKKNPSIQIEALQELIRFNRITGDELRGVLPNLETIVRLDAGNIDAWKQIASIYKQITEISVNIDTLTKLDTAATALVELEPEKAYGHSLKLLVVSHQLLSAFSTDALSDKEKAEEMVSGLLEKYPNDPYATEACALYNSYLVRQSTTLAAKQNVLERSAKMLRRVIESHPQAPQGYLNYFKYYIELNREALLAEMQNQPNRQESPLKQDVADFYSAAIQEFNLALLKFSDNPEIIVAKANFMSLFPDADYGEVKKLYQQAVAINPDNLVWNSVLGKLCYILSGGREDNQLLQDARSYLRKAYYGFSEQSLLSIQGSRDKAIRFSEVMPFLALVNTVLFDTSEQARVELEEVSQALADGLGNVNALTRSCQGLLAMARGQQQMAIQKLYSAVSDENTSQLSPLYLIELRWKLFELLKDSQYVMEALRNGVQSFSSRGRSAADFIEIIDTYMEIKTANARQEMVQLIEIFSKRYEKDTEYYPLIRIRLAKVLLALGDNERAKEVITDISVESLELDILRAQIIDDVQKQTEAFEAIARKYPGERTVVNTLYGRYLSGLKDNPTNHEKLKKLLESAVAAEPQNYYFLQEQAKLNEPDPLNISKERMFELQLQTVDKITDEYEKSMTAGRLYASRASQSSASTEDSVSDRLKALDYFEQAASLDSDSTEPLTSIMTTYLTMKDFSKAESLVTRLRAVDEYLARFAEIDILVARENYLEAERRLTEYLSESPLSASGHLVLSKVYMKLDRKAEAKRELEISLEQDRFNADAIVDYLALLHEDFIRIGLDSVGPEKIQSMISWIEQLLAVSPNNIQGMRFFVQYAPYWARVLDGQLTSPNLDMQTAQTYRQVIVNVGKMLQQNINLLLGSLSENESIYIICANSLETMSKLSVLANNNKAYLDAIENIYSAGLSRIPGSASLASSYELFLRKSGRNSGQGLDALKEMLSNSTGKEHFDTVMTLARFYFSDGDIDSAVDLLLKEIELTDNLDYRKDMRVWLANIYKSMNMFEKALETYVVQRQEKDSDELMTLHIEALMDAGYTDQARPLLEKMEAQYPDDHKVYLLKAKYALRETDYLQAVKFADQALALSPGERVGLLLKAQAQFYKDDLYDAVQTINELRLKTSQDSNDGRLLLAQINIRLRKYDDAIIELQKALEVQPNDPQLNNLLTNVLTSRKRWSELVSYYQKQMRNFPNQYSNYADCARAMMQWAEDLKRQGNNSFAEQKLAEALSLLDRTIIAANEQQAPVAGLVDTRLELLLKSGKYEQVLSSLAINADLASSNPQLLMRKMEALQLGGNEKEALTVLGSILDLVSGQAYLELVVERAASYFAPDVLTQWADALITNSKDRVALYMIKAVAAREASQDEQFIANSKKALEAAKGNATLEFVANTRLAIASIQTKNYAEAIEIYRKLVDEVPGNYSLLNNLAYALLEQGGNATEALEVAREAYSLARLEPMVLDTYGMALLANDSADEARQVFSKAIQEIQRNNQEVPVEFEYHLAQSLVKGNRVDEATEMLEGLLGRARVSQNPADLRMVDSIQKLLQEIKN